MLFKVTSDHFFCVLIIKIIIVSVKKVLSAQWSVIDLSMVKIWRLELNVVHVMRGGGGNSAGGGVRIRVCVGSGIF